MKKLETHLRFTALLAELSANFVRFSIDEIDREILDSLRQIAESLDLDHVTIGEMTPDGQDFSSSYSYSKPHTTPWNGLSLMTEAPFLTQTLLAGQVFVMDDVAQLPPEADIDREGFLRYGIRADLVFPFIVNNVRRGGIGFASATPRKWTMPVIQGLRLISDVFANALDRKHSEKALRENEQYMRLASDAANVGLWAWDIKQDSIWATHKSRLIYDIPATDTLDFSRFLKTVHPDDVQRITASITAALNQGVDFKEEYRVVHRDGSIRFLSASGRFQLDQSGSPEKLMGATLDVTELRHANMALEQSHAELKRAFNEINQLKDQLQQENVYLWREMVDHPRVTSIIGVSQAMQPVLQQIEQVAPTPASVLISGETGTGKELIAAAIHEASARNDKPMIKVNCAAIPAALFESELFGHEKGAYTGALAKQIGRFELASGSSLFLDEVGELPLEIQAKLLRVLQEKEIDRLGNPKPIKVDARIIAATNRDLALEVSAGRFREDLYYRLNVFPIHLPPLRERREDIPGLVTRFAEEFAKAMGKTIHAVNKSSLRSLCSYDWPGNIRELRNVIERAVILAQDPILKVDLLPHTALSKAAKKSVFSCLADVEREHIVRVLEATGWRIRGEEGAAAILGLKPTTLESRMAKLKIYRPSLS